jgi:hypothetical protein
VLSFYNSLDLECSFQKSFKNDPPRLQPLGNNGLVPDSWAQSGSESRLIIPQVLRAASVTVLIEAGH